jgi:hypothetical protein
MKQEAAATQPKPTPYFHLYMFFQMHTSEGWCNRFMLISQCMGQSGSLHSNFYSCSTYMAGQITEQEADTTQPRPTPCWQVYLFFLIHTSK